MGQRPQSMGSISALFVRSVSSLSRVGECVGVYAIRLARPCSSRTRAHHCHSARSISTRACWVDGPTRFADRLHTYVSSPTRLLCSCVLFLLACRESAVSQSLHRRC